MFEFKGYDVYIKIDNENRIISVDSNAFLNNFEGWTLIESGLYGDRGHHAQGNYFDKPIYDDRGVCRYKLVDGVAVERTQDEMDADYENRPAPEQTTEELLLEMAADHEYRICLMELGIDESEVI